jgi:hypothetical protein
MAATIGRPAGVGREATRFLQHRILFTSSWGKGGGGAATGRGRCSGGKVLQQLVVGVIALAYGRIAWLVASCFWFPCWFMKLAHAR